MFGIMSRVAASVKSAFDKPGVTEESRETNKKTLSQLNVLTHSLGADGKATLAEFKQDRGKMDRYMERLRREGRGY